MTSLSYIVIGCFMGGMFGTLFIRMDKLWKELVFSGGGLSVVFGILVGMNGYFEISKTTKISFSTIYILSFVISFILLFIGTCYLIKKQTDKVRIRVLDILLGYSEYYKQYYESRNRELEAEIHTDIIEKEQRKIDERKQNIEDRERELYNQLQNHVYFELPISGKVPMNNVFLQQMPNHVKQLVLFYNHLYNITTDFETEYNSSTNKIDYINGYFVAICVAINSILFGSSIDNVRTHIRFLKNDEYVKYLAVEGKKTVLQDLTRIPCNSGMITEALKQQCSLVKSINPEHHHPATHDRKWKDYISFVLLKSNNEEQVISMGISIADKTIHQNLLFLLNACHIEEFICNQVERINTKCNIIKTVNHLEEAEN